MSGLVRAGGQGCSICGGFHERSAVFAQHGQGPLRGTVRKETHRNSAIVCRRRSSVGARLIVVVALC